MSWNLVERYQHFGGTCCLHLQHRRVYSLTLIMEALTLFYYITWHHIPRDSNVQSHCCETIWMLIILPEQVQIKCTSQHLLRFVLLVFFCVTVLTVRWILCPWTRIQIATSTKHRTSLCQKSGCISISCVLHHAHHCHRKTETGVYETSVPVSLHSTIYNKTPLQCASLYSGLVMSPQIIPFIFFVNKFVSNFTAIFFFINNFVQRTASIAVRVIWPWTWLVIC